MDRPVIMLRDVYHRYNAGSPIEKEVLSDINLEIKHGETVGIIGTPGSGKTTLAMIMSGLEMPSSGLVDTPGPGRGKVGLVLSELIQTRLGQNLVQRAFIDGVREGSQCRNLSG